MKIITLNHGLSALVDDADFERVAAKHWRVIQPNKGGAIYATSYEGPRKTRRAIYMHRFIVGALPEQQVDHWNRNGLDNRRENLRLCTGTFNNANSKLPRTNTTGFKGVSHHSNKYWVAHVQYRRRHVHIGMFPTAIDAARAYDAKALELFGEFARTNAMLGLL